MESLSKRAKMEDDEVTFIFPNEDGKTLVASKTMLSESSEVFQKLFESGMERRQISIRDISFETFDKVIRHLRGERITVTNIILEMLYISRKYFLNELTSFTIEAAKRELCSEEYLLKYFVDISQFNLLILDDYMSALIWRNPKNFIERLEITSYNHLKILKVILESEVFGCKCTEFQLYQSIMAMIKRSKGDLTWDEVKERMGKLIYLIRFPCMTIDELVLCAEPPSLLTRDQICDVQLWVKKNTFSETIQLFTSLKKRFQLFGQICPDHTHTLNGRNCSVRDCDKSKQINVFTQ